MGIGYCNRCKRYDGHDTNCPTVVGEPGEQQLRSRIEQLQARARELEKESAELNEQVDMQIPKLAFAQLQAKLAASQLHAEQLREAIDRVRSGAAALGLDRIFDIATEALALPHDTSALDAYVAEKVKESMK